ncbi:MAG: alpha-N-arabinofuranosidase, partial [Clostridiales bacterium]|nr:alpha-N-arabinofuranosidase [Clostridiales bacterium]
VWYRLAKLDEEKNEEPWRIAPKQLEDSYTFDDAVLVATMLNTLINNCDRVKIACLAQLVNVIAPIMTEPNGGIYLQTTYYPYYFASVYGRGEALFAAVDAPTYDCEAFSGAQSLHVSGVRNKDELFVMLVNRSACELPVTVSLRGARIASVKECKQMKSESLACNTALTPHNVVPFDVSVSVTDNGVQLVAPAESIHFIRLAL